MENNQPIVIKKNKKIQAGHHGGSWKVAYADFVTAMMAFFLLMWLLGSTTDGQRAAISDFFQNPSVLQADTGGAPTPVDMGGGMAAPEQPEVNVIEHKDAPPTPPGTEDQKGGEAQLGLQELERQRFEKLLEELQAAIEASQSLRAFKDQLLLDITPEGLRIQILDQDQRSMFDLGSALLKSYTRGILNDIATFITRLPNKISITGHTDARQYFDAAGYTNWELSADRANAARRQLLQGGMDQEKVIRVEGLASRVLLDKQDPFNSANRRISIVILNSQAEKDILRNEETYSIDIEQGRILSNPQNSAARAPATPAAMPDARPAQDQEGRPPTPTVRPMAAPARTPATVPAPTRAPDNNTPPDDAPAPEAPANKQEFIKLPQLPGSRPPVAPGIPAVPGLPGTP